MKKIVFSANCLAKLLLYMHKRKSLSKQRARQEKYIELFSRRKATTELCYSGSIPWKQPGISAPLLAEA